MVDLFAFRENLFEMEVLSGNPPSIYLELVMNRFQKWRVSVIPADVIDSVLPWNDEICNFRCSNNGFPASQQHLSVF